MTRKSLACAALWLVGCGGGAATPADGGSEAGADLGAADLSAPDLGAVDLSAPDLGADSGCADRDGDGHADIACGGDDCDDGDPHRYPGNPEVCDTLGHDDDCNAATLGADVDGDGFASTSCCNIGSDGALRCGDDCNDSRATVNPSAVESCNGVDDDCNGMIDDGVQITFYRDVDGDGYGVDTMTMSACSAPSGYAVLGGDCDDTRASVHPGAPDICDGLDNDCVGGADPAPCMCVDGATRMCGTPDGAGGFSTIGICRIGTQRCIGGAWEAVCPGGVLATTETCNGLDDNCDGVVDEMLTRTCYHDGDGDRYAPSGAAPMTLCLTGGSCPAGSTGRAPVGISTIDCNDGDINIHPGATGAECGTDLNCDGSRYTGAICTAGVASSITVCGLSCSEPCTASGPTACMHSCDCTLSTTRIGGWQGDSPGVTRSGTFFCNQHLDTTAHWDVLDPSPFPCDLAVAPSSGAVVPNGTFSVQLWLVGNLTGSIHVRDGSSGMDLVSGGWPFVLGSGLCSAPGAINCRDFSGFKIVEVNHVPMAGSCIPVNVDVHLDSGSVSGALASIYIDRDSATVTSAQESAVLCP